jgi:hypothetical protein
MPIEVVKITDQPKTRHPHDLADSRLASVVVLHGALRWLRGVPGIALAPYQGRTPAAASPSSKCVSLLITVGGLVKALSHSELKECKRNYLTKPN